MFEDELDRRVSAHREALSRSESATRRESSISRITSPGTHTI
jgi:hypothetical protein